MSTGYDNTYSTYDVYEVEIDTQRRTFGQIPNAENMLEILHKHSRDLQGNWLTKS